jgi:tetratricopeptide (TPR) repeat protein
MSRKSQIAIEYSYRLRDQFPQVWVFWVHASNRVRFEQAYREIANRVEIPGREDPKADILQMVYGWLTNEVNGSWLMILDNADDARMFSTHDDANRGRDARNVTSLPLASYLPQSRHGSILVTSRDKHAAIELTGHSKNIIDVKPMNPREGIELLKTRIEIEKPTETDAERLLRDLDYIPLAITQAGAYIDKRRPRMTILSYLQLLHENESNQARLLCDDQGDLRRDRTVPNAIIATWEISFNQMRVDRPSAADLLALMSVLDRQGIPESLLHEVFTSRLDFEQALDPLIGFSLINAELENRAFEMHRLVQIATWRWLELQGELTRWQDKAIELISNNFPNGEHENWLKCQILYPHSAAVLTYRPAEDASSLQQADILHNMAWYTWATGRYNAAKEMIESAISTKNRHLSEDDSSLLASVGLCGMVLRAQGEYKGAEELEMQMMETSSRVLGQEHPSTLTSMANLASTFWNQGRRKEAEELDVQVMETSSRVLGQEHPDTLTSMYNLAWTWKFQDRNREAVNLMVGCIYLRKKKLGVDHPHTKLSLEALSAWQSDQNLLRR